MPGWLGGLLVMVATISLVLTAKNEERENLEKFGDEYAAYMQGTKMFVPYLF
jgi:protein-S-isoprenylcysteine O-methyltransferase Ste14